MSSGNRARPDETERLDGQDDFILLNVLDTFFNSVVDGGILCPICRNDSLSFNSEGFTKIKGESLKNNIASLNFPPYNIGFEIDCRRCGWLQRFNNQPFEGWLIKQRAEKSDES